MSVEQDNTGSTTIQKPSEYDGPTLSAGSSSDISRPLRRWETQSWEDHSLPVARDPREDWLGVVAICILLLVLLMGDGPENPNE